MSSRLFQIVSGNQSAALTADTPKIATGTSLKALLQIAPAVGFEVVEWGISFDGSAAATPGQVELVEVDVAASGGTSSYVPGATVSTAITSAATTSLVLNNAIQASAATFQIATMAFQAGPTTAGTGGGEQMQVTSGGATATLTVTRGVNDTTALSSIPAGTFVYGIPGTGVYSDVIPLSSQPAADPLYALLCQTGTALTGFGFSTYNSPTRVRVLDSQLLPPTAPYIKQFPLERGPQVNPGRFLQVRCTFGTTVNAYCYVTVAA
jgi:hypothetical protein